MWKFIKVFIAGIAVSCYFFPFEFTFLPGVNTKMAMAGVGLVLYALDLAKGRAPQINKDGFIITVLGLLVSLCGLLAVTVNSTNDYTYTTYIVSMLVWLGGAYTATRIIKLIHGYLSVWLVCNYLIFVCVGQCVLALVIDSIPSFQLLVNRVVVGFDFVNTELLSDVGRLYGIGAALDVAGTRFSAILVMIAVMVLHLSQSDHKYLIWLYLAAFILITIVGNMMARTTTVGVVVAVFYWIMASGLFRLSLKKDSIRVWQYFIIMLCLILPVIVYMYSVDKQFQSYINFAFEGFFSMAETGRWETNSNNILINMIVFPDNIKTWLIGDGYIENPNWSDPYYVGPYYGGYYKGTDIGYLRFVFYFGLIGLFTFILYFYTVAQVCRRRFRQYATMFWLVLAINMIIWLKVSTDIFLVFAIFLCVSKEENDAYEKQYEDSLPDPLDI